MQNDQLPDVLDDAGDVSKDVLNDAGDVCKDVLYPLQPIVLGPADPTRTITNNEIYLALLHSKIKSCTILPLNSKFNAMPCYEYRLF
jgi:hypothetical protein